LFVCFDLGYPYVAQARFVLAPHTKASQELRLQACTTMHDSTLFSVVKYISERKELEHFKNN
jgi:hypothetical protein